MMRYVFLLFLTIFIGFHENANCQEEFFGNKNGASLAYLNGFNMNAKATGVSIYFKKGIILGMGYEYAGNLGLTSLNLLFCPNWEDQNKLRFGAGPSIVFVPETYSYILGMNAGLVKSFNNKSKFPFSINASVSPQILLIKNQSTSQPFQSEKYYNEVSLVLGCGYTQAFFTNNNLYPFIGLSFAREPEINKNLFSAMVGINIIIGN